MTRLRRHLHGTCPLPGRTFPESFSPRTLPVWAAALLEIFSKGSRGGTWHVPRGTWRHVTNAIVVPALWRIFWCLSRPDRTVRSAGAINEKSLDRQILGQTGPRPSCDITPILLHYDFELTLTDKQAGPVTLHIAGSGSKSLVFYTENFFDPEEISIRRKWTPLTFGRVQILLITKFDFELEGIMPQKRIYALRAQF